MKENSEPTRALVLSGGGARGAYEAGVLAYIFQELPAELLARGPIKIFSGTSVGAIHACYLAATAHIVRRDVPRMLDLWRGLNIEQVLRLRSVDLMRLPGTLRSLFRKEKDVAGVVLNSRVLQQVVTRAIPWTHIRRNLQHGPVDALTVSTTHVASGKTVVFIDRPRGGLPAWTRDNRRLARAAHINPLHALASAAIPILFPAIEIAGAYFCDGGLRQNTPLSPALRLGADRVLVITLSHGHGPDVPQYAHGQGSEAYPGPFLLLGKVLNALMLDHLDYDLSRLNGINQLLKDGTMAFGPSFVDRLNETTAGVRGAGYKHVDTTVIHPSRDLGEIANEWVMSGAAKTRGVPGWILRTIAAQDSANDSDLLSYMCFDGRLAAALIELGMADADAARSQLIEYFKS